MVLVFRILISNLPTIFSKSIIKIWLNLRKSLLPSSSFNVISSEDLGKKGYIYYPKQNKRNNAYCEESDLYLRVLIVTINSKISYSMYIPF